MHKLEYALLRLSERANDDKLASTLAGLASVSHNYTPPKRPELDIPEDSELLVVD